MSFVQGSAIEKAMKGSMETLTEAIHQCVHDHYTDSALNIVATFEGHVLAFNEDKKLLKITYGLDEENNLVVTGAKPSKAIPVIEAADIPNHVSKELKGVVKKMMAGKKVSRTQVRELAAFTQKDEMYWMSDILSKIEESTGDADWYKMYEANLERIRTSLHGRIREIEGQVPRTHYTRIAKAKLEEFDKEIRESLTILTGLFGKLCEDCRVLTFPDKQDFLGVVRESLIAEAQAVVSLLGKAEKLAGRDDLPLVASAHDKLADRARTMVLVSAYIKGKSQPNDKE